MELTLPNFILGDCMEYIKEIPDKYFDLIITSPPYNLGENHHTGNIRHNPYQDNLPEEEYQEWQIDVLNECCRVLKSDGSMFYNHKNRIKKKVMITPYEWILKSNFILKQELVWFNGSQNFDKCRFYPMTERVYWLVKDKGTQLFNTINHHDVFDTNDWKPEGTKKSHKRAFPVQMPRDIISCFPNAKTVLDPFMGSGTVGVACIEKGLDYLGFEIDEDYYNAAVKRLERVKAQQSIFDLGVER